MAGILAAMLATWLIAPTDAWAKHKKQSSDTASAADPCAEPTKFVKDQLVKIRALQAAQTARPTNTVYSLFSSQPHADPDSYAQIDGLRRDADAVNEMLRTGGCKPIDIDQELKNTPVPPPTPVTQKRKKHSSQ
jgi:hypothetical protein